MGRGANIAYLRFFFGIGPGLLISLNSSIGLSDEGLNSDVTGKSMERQIFAKC